MLGMYIMGLDAMVLIISENAIAYNYTEYAEFFKVYNSPIDSNSCVW